MGIDTHCVMPIARGDLQLMLEADILRHFPYVQAGAAGDPQAARAAVSVPEGMDDLKMLLRKQGCKLDARDPWSMLGMGPLCGPEPCEQDIASRARIACLLLSLARGSSWGGEDRQAATQL